VRSLQRMVPAQGAAVPWWYAKELQGVRKLVEQQGQSVKNTEAEMRGLQRRIAQTAQSLTQRVEALEANNPAGAGKIHNDTLSCSLDAVTNSIADLESRFEKFRKDSTERMEASKVELEEFRDRVCCKAPDPIVDLQICVPDASMRHSADLGTCPQERAPARPRRATWSKACHTPRTPDFGSLVLPAFPGYKELWPARTPTSTGDSNLTADACSTDSTDSIDTNLLSSSSFSTSSCKGSTDWDDSTPARLQDVMSHVIQRVVSSESCVFAPRSTDELQLVIPEPQAPNVPVVVWETPLPPLPRPCPLPPPEVQSNNSALWWLATGVQAADS